MFFIITIPCMVIISVVVPPAVHWVAADANFRTPFMKFMMSFMVGAVARFDSELNEIGSSIFSFWGCKAAGHDPLTGTVIVLEVCCGYYFDRYLPPSDW